jgi:hypothetical protein
MLVAMPLASSATLCHCNILVVIKRFSFVLGRHAASPMNGNLSTRNAENRGVFRPIHTDVFPLAANVEGGT